MLETLANAQRKYHSCRPPKRNTDFLQRRAEARRVLSPNWKVHPSESFCQRDMSYLGDTDELALSYGAQVALGYSKAHPKCRAGL